MKRCQGLYIDRWLFCMANGEINPTAFARFFEKDNILDQNIVQRNDVSCGIGCTLSSGRLNNGPVNGSGLDNGNNRGSGPVNGNGLDNGNGPVSGNGLDNGNGPVSGNGPGEDNALVSGHAHGDRRKVSGSRQRAHGRLEISRMKAKLDMYKSPSTSTGY